MIEITEDDLHDAYRFARLRRIGIGYLTAITSPDLLAALRGTALMMKRQRQTVQTTEPEALPAVFRTGRKKSEEAA